MLSNGSLPLKKNTGPLRPTVKWYSDGRSSQKTAICIFGFKDIVLNSRVTWGRSVKVFGSRSLSCTLGANVLTAQEVMSIRRDTTLVKRLAIV